MPLRRGRDGPLFRKEGGGDKFGQKKQIFFNL